MSSAERRQYGHAPNSGIAAVDPYSHDQTAAAVARLTAVIEAQARTIGHYESAMARSREVFERASAAARLGLWECDLATETLQWSGGTYDMFDIARDRPLKRRQCLIRYPAESLKTLNETALQPFMHGKIEQGQALKNAEAPIRKFMMKQTRQGELALFIKASGDKKPAKPSDVSMTALIPAYILSELKTAFIIGFVIFVPFLVIDLVVSSSLMSMGMMMLPPVLISLPFKLLLFVMVDGWALVVRALISSFN